MTALYWPGTTEWLIIGIVLVIIFGRRLPEVGRNLGRGLVEFKKGLRGVKDDVDDAVSDAKDVSSEARKAGEDDHPKG